MRVFKVLFTYSLCVLAGAIYDGANFTNIYVLNTKDSIFVSTQGNCLKNSSICNLRSAVSSCLSLISNISICNIYLPPNSIIEIDSTIGQPIDIQPLNLFGTLKLVLYGEKSVIICRNPTSGLCNIQFMRILFVDEEISKSLFVSLYNFTLQGFGYGSSSSSTGSALHITGTARITLDSLIFLDNYGEKGGAIRLKSTTGSNGGGGGGGGGLYLSSQNFNISISYCNITRNEVSSSSSSSSGGGGIYVDNSNYYILLSNSIFQNNIVHNIGGGGGGLFFNSFNHHISIFNCKIISNLALLQSEGGGIYLDEIYRSNGVTGSGGGGGGAMALNTANRNIVISTCIFTYNTGYYGGVLYINEMNYNISISNSLFERNSAVSSGGAICIITGNYQIILSNISLINNNAKSGDNIVFLRNFAQFIGGAFYIQQGNDNINMQSNIFRSNQALEGGAISITLLNSNILFSETIFESNIARSGATIGDGGAISIGNYNNGLSFELCTFISNIAWINGGSMYLLAWNSFISITTTSFLNNIALEGGAICFDQQVTDIRLTSVHFNGNIASKLGGAIIIGVRCLRILMIDCNVQNNQAVEQGGGIYIGSYNSYLSFEKCHFVNNSVGVSSGGAIYLSQSNSFFNFKYNRIENNTASINGGGLYLETLNTNISIFSTTFLLNTASTSGGGLYSDSFNNFIILSCNFTQNTAQKGSGGSIFSLKYNSVTIVKTRFVENRGALYGGSIACSTNHASVFIAGCVFYGNNAVSVSSSSDASGGPSSNGGSGGGISVYGVGNSNIRIQSCRFSRNTAGNAGGSVYIVNTIGFIMKQSMITYSRAGSTGGGVSVSGGKSCFFEDLRFDSNTATFQGGGIFVSSASSVQINRCSMYRCVSVQSSGSAIFLFGTKPVSVQKSIFVDNIAASGGGAFFWYDVFPTEPAGLRVTNVWSGNRAAYGPDYATDVFRIRSPPMVIVRRQSSNVYIPAIPVTLYDFYEQKVISSNNELINTFMDKFIGCDPFPSPLKGVMSVLIVNGTANFTSLLTQCLPEGQLTLTFSITTLTSTFINPTITTVVFPSFQPTTVPTQQPVLLISDADKNSNLSEIQTIAISVPLSIFSLVLLICSLWRWVFSTKAKMKRLRRKRLAELPLHQLIINYHPSNYTRIIDLLNTNPEYIKETDFDGLTVLGVIFESNNHRNIPSEVIYQLLLHTLPMDHESSCMIGSIQPDSNWFHAVQRDDNETVSAVKRVLSLCLPDNAGGDVIVDRAAVAIAASSSMATAATIDRNVQLVALKFLNTKEQFIRETEARNICNFDAKYVIPILHSYNGDNNDNEDDMLFRDDAILKGYEEYPYCIVMAAATQSLKHIIDCDNLMGMSMEEIQQLTRQLVTCLDHVHQKGFIHGDLKPPNILQKGLQLVLTDFDKCSNVLRGDRASSLTSSGYMPPEKFFCDSENDGLISVKFQQELHTNQHIIPNGEGFGAEESDGDGVEQIDLQNNLIQKLSSELKEVHSTNELLRKHNIELLNAYKNICDSKYEE
eukprot:gene5463-10990_t